MKFVAPANDSQYLAEHQQDSENEQLPEAHGFQHISLSAAAVLRQVGEALIWSAEQHAIAERTAALRKTANDNVAKRNRAGSNRKGRVWASQVRRIQNELNCSQRNAINVLAESLGYAAIEIETLVRLHNRRREARVETIRQDALIRYRTAGLSNKQIAERLNITPQHVGRLIREFKVG
tara:strand:+ start:4632 stop:5168 length:537 start_codon:yes stop_codon:yes gene_type:complete